MNFCIAFDDSSDHTTSRESSTSFSQSTSSSISVYNKKFQSKRSFKLEETSVVCLLELFFRYLTEDFDILASIITIRGKGEVSGYILDVYIY